MNKLSFRLTQGVIAVVCLIIYGADGYARSSGSTSLLPALQWVGGEKAYIVATSKTKAPGMFVNAKLLKHFYRQIKNGVDKIQPFSYWSEMEALNTIWLCGT
jgi:hypothetical protein